MKPVDLYINKLGGSLTLDVRIQVTRRFKVRMAIAKCLLGLAARVLGCGINIEGVKYHVERSKNL